MKFEDVYKRTAQQNNINQQKMIEEMQYAIDTAMNNPEFRDKWVEIKGNKDTVTPDDLIEYLVNKLTEDLNL